MKSLGEVGGRDRDRTCDPYHVKVGTKREFNDIAGTEGPAVPGPCAFDASNVLDAGSAVPRSTMDAPAPSAENDGTPGERDATVKTGWMPISSAPRDGTPFQARIPGHGSDNIIAATMVEDDDGSTTWAWFFVEEQEPPDCWTDGVCWAVNEDGVASVQPTEWKPLPPEPTP